MALYESNFIKLSQLVPGLGQSAGSLVSTTPDDFDLHLSFGRRSKYTCELRLTYLFSDVGGAVADPDLLARVYFDARLVEVCGWTDVHHHELLRMLSRRYGHELNLCWTRNLMLAKWLDYLRDRGHRFGSSP